MYKTVLENIVRPLLTRLGSYGSGLLVGAGVATHDATVISVGVTTAALVGIDLIASYINRKALERKAVQEAVRGGVVR